MGQRSSSGTSGVRSAAAAEAEEEEEEGVASEAILPRTGVKFHTARRRDNIINPGNLCCVTVFLAEHLSTVQYGYVRVPYCTVYCINIQYTVLYCTVCYTVTVQY